MKVSQAGGLAAPGVRGQASASVAVRRRVVAACAVALLAGCRGDEPTASARVSAEPGERQTTTSTATLEGTQAAPAPPPGAAEAAAESDPASETSPAPTTGERPGAAQTATPKAAATATAATATAATATAATATAAEPATPKAAAEPAAAGATEERKGPVASDEAFVTYLRAQSPARVGQPVSVEVVLEARPPYHCNTEYPHKLKLGQAPPALSYPSDVVRGMQVTEQRGVLAVPVTARAAGQAKIEGKLSFSVCTDERCLIEKRDLSVAIDIVD